MEDPTQVHDSPDAIDESLRLARELDRQQMQRTKSKLLTTVVIVTFAIVALVFILARL